MKYKVLFFRVKPNTFCPFLTSEAVGGEDYLSWLSCVHYCSEESTRRMSTKLRKVSVFQTIAHCSTLREGARVLDRGEVRHLWLTLGRSLLPQSRG